MVDLIEIEAKSIDDAVEQACERFCVSREKLNIEIITDGSSGFLGIGSKKAKIQASLINFNVDFTDESLPPQEQQTAIVAEDERKMANRGRNFLLNLLAKMGFEKGVSYKVTAENIILTIDGESDSLIIGKMGQNLDALQHIVNKAVDKGKPLKQMLVDMGDYRRRRRATLITIAKRLSDKAKRSHKQVSIGNMKAYDRRIIHMALEKDSQVTTKSVGEGEQRKILIIPAKKNGGKSSKKE